MDILRVLKEVLKWIEGLDGWEYRAHYGRKSKSEIRELLRQAIEECEAQAQTV